MYVNSSVMILAPLSFIFSMPRERQKLAIIRKNNNKNRIQLKKKEQYVYTKKIQLNQLQCQFGIGSTIIRIEPNSLQTAC